MSGEENIASEVQCGCQEHPYIDVACSFAHDREPRISMTPGGFAQDVRHTQQSQSYECIVRLMHSYLPPQLRFFRTGSRCGHLDESLFDNELMTPILGDVRGYPSFVSTRPSNSPRENEAASKTHLIDNIAAT